MICRLFRKQKYSFEFAFDINSNSLSLSETLGVAFTLLYYMNQTKVIDESFFFSLNKSSITHIESLFIFVYYR